MISINEISKKTGFSTATISRALDLRYCTKVKESTRKKILALCDQYQYRPKFSAQALASGKTYTIGLISPDVEAMMISPNYSLFISFLTHELKKLNYSLSILPIGDDLATINQEILHTFYSSRVDGFMLMASIVNVLTLNELVRHKFPVVTFLMPSEELINDPPVNHVYFDNSTAYRDLLRHLKKQGHSRIAFIGMESHNNNIRHQQCLKCAYKEGMNITENDIFLFAKATPRPELVFFTYQEILKQWKRVKNYTAWIMNNDQMAQGACAALKSLGFEPGRNVAVAGYDNIEENRLYGDGNLFLTTINPPLEKLAVSCVQLLLNQIANPQTAPPTNRIACRINYS